MAQYKYKARTLEGKVIKGIMTVADDTELQQKLHEQDAFLLSAKADCVRCYSGQGFEYYGERRIRKAEGERRL